jgi:transposase
MPSPTHKPTDLTRQTVQLHATVGTDQELIAQIIGIGAKTLRKHYRAELDLSTAKANATVGGALFNKAKGGDTAAMIFWMKTRAGWTEKTVVDNTSSDGSMAGASALERINSKLARLADARDKAGDTSGSD